MSFEAVPGWGSAGAVCAGEPCGRSPTWGQARLTWMDWGLQVLRLEALRAVRTGSGHRMEAHPPHAAPSARTAWNPNRLASDRVGNVTS